MADNIVQIEVEFEDGKKGFAYLKSESKKTGEEAGGEFGKSFVDGLVPGLKTALKVAGALTTVLGAIFSKESIDAAIEQENAINRFNQALARSGQFTKTFSKDFQEYVGTLQASTKFADEAILSNAALLQTIGNLSQSQLKPATQAAVDLAAAYGIGLEQAFEIVGKAANGQTTALTKLGLEVKKGATDAETFANALGLIQSRVGGAATGEINTFSGALALAKNAFGEILEAFGGFITGSPGIIKAIKGIGDIFNNIARSLSGNTAIAQFIENAIENLVPFATAVNMYLLRPLEILLQIGNVVFQTLESLIAKVVLGLGAFGLAINKILNSVGLVSDQIVKDSEATFEALAINAIHAKEDIDTALNSVGSTAFTDGVTAQIDTMSAALRETSKEMDVVKGKLDTELPASAMTFSQAWTQAINETKITTVQFAKTIQTALVQGISNGFAAVGRSLVSGKNGFQEFGKAVLGTLGGLAIQLGQFFILVGTGMTATGALLGFSGAGAIAAGIGLTILGGVLQALSGGGGDIAVGATSTGEGNIGGGGASNLAATELTPTEQRQQRGTDVVVNVEGNVFNGREQAQLIAENLQEYFDTNNGLLVRS